MSDFSWDSVTSDRGAIPDGFYTASFYRYDVKVSEYDGTPRVSFQIKVLDGDYAGRIFFKSYKLEAPNYTKATARLYQDLITLDLKAASDKTHPTEAQLDKLFNEMLGKVCVFKFKTSKLPGGKDWQGVYIESYEVSATKNAASGVPVFNKAETFSF